MAEFVETLTVGVVFAIDSGGAKKIQRQFQGYASSLKAAGKRLGDIGGQTIGAARVGLGRVASGFASVGTAAAGMSTLVVGAGVALGAFGVSQAMAQSETAKLAKGMRSSTEELTTLQFAAKRTGVEGGALIEVMRALGANITRGAIEPTSAQAKALNAMGLSARNAAGDLKSPVEILPEMAAKLEGMTDSAQRSDIMIKLMGESASKLEPLLAVGASGIAMMSDEARRLGAVLSNEAAANSEELVDSLQDLRSVTGALARRVGDEMIPHLTDAANATTEWLLTTDNFMRVGFGRAIVGLSFALDGLHTPLGQAVAGTVGFGAAVGALSKALPALNAGLKVLGVTTSVGLLPLTVAIGTVAAVGLVIDDLLVTLDGGQSTIRRFADSLGVGDEVVSILGSTVTIATDSIALGFTIMGEAVTLSLDALGDGVEIMGDVADGAAEAFPPLKFVADAIDTIGEAIDGLPNLPQFLLGSLSKNLAGVADITTRARAGDIDPDLIAGLAASDVGPPSASLGVRDLLRTPDQMFTARATGSDRIDVGSILATLLESSAQRGETGRGFGVGEAFNRRGEIQDIGATTAFERTGMVSVGGGNIDPSVQFDRFFGNEAQRQITSGALGGPATAIAGLARQPTQVQSAVNLTLNLGASIQEIADQAAEQVRQATITQLSAVEDLR